MADLLQAQTPQQVHSWPIATPPTTITGEPLSPAETERERKDAILSLARERFKIACEALDKNRLDMVEDTNFANGKQWEKAIEDLRVEQHRPCLTINRIDGFLAHVVNNMRQARPSIKVEPVADGADEEIAQVRQGIIRHIEINSKADMAYDHGFRWMCITGLGWMRIVDDWEAPDSFDQGLFIRWVPNPFSVYPDPFCRQPDWSDMRYLFQVEDLTRADFIARYGKDTETASLTNFNGLGDAGPFWFPGGKIRVAEYWRVEYYDDILCESADGKTTWWSKMDHTVFVIEDTEDGQRGLFMRDPNDDTVTPHYVGRASERQRPEVHWAKISGCDVLKERKWKGEYIPYIPVIGNQTEIDGERNLCGMIRFAREPQRMYNYMYSSFVETVALAPKAPFIAEIDQIPDGVAQMWAQANTLIQGVLLYKAKVAENGNLVPPPQRNPASPDIAAFVQGLQMCDANLKSVFRIFDASLGQRGPQESGLAINARKIESDTGVFDWGDQFIRAQRMVGIQLNDLLEYYYNTPGRQLKILQEDDQSVQITLMKEFKRDGQVKFYNLAGGGRFNVVISSQPSYTTRRKEASQSMLEVAKIYPAILQIAGDIMISEMDWAGKDAIADRLKKALPAQFQEKDPDAPPIPPEIQGQLAQMQQMIQQLTGMLHAATDKNNLERLKQEFETMRTQMVQEANLAIAQLKTGSSEGQFLSTKLFERLSQFEQFMQQVALAPPAAAGASADAGPAGPTSSAVPPTVGGNPSVGG